MSDWQQNFFLENWSRALWKRDLNEAMLQFEGNRDVLLVAFDPESGNNKFKSWRPWGAEFAQEHDICYLGFSTIVPDWYLSTWVDEELKKLLNEGFFDRFSRVVFAGHSMGAHAALRFSQYVDGAYVAAFSPQITLEAGRADFDERFNEARRLPWRGAETDASTFEYDADHSWVFYDPQDDEDRQHAEALEKSGANLLRTYHSGHGSMAYLRRVGVANEILSIICFGTLKPLDFYRLLRNRRTVPWFRKSLEAYFNQKGRFEMVTRVQDAVSKIKTEFAESRFQPNSKKEP
jgi:hypothetical protein